MPNTTRTDRSLVIAFDESERLAKLADALHLETHAVIDALNNDGSDADEPRPEFTDLLHAVTTLRTIVSDIEDELVAAHREHVGPMENVALAAARTALHDAIRSLSSPLVIATMIDALIAAVRGPRVPDDFLDEMQAIVTEQREARSREAERMASMFSALTLGGGRGQVH